MLSYFLICFQKYETESFTKLVGILDEGDGLEDMLNCIDPDQLASLEDICRISRRRDNIINENGQNDIIYQNVIIYYSNDRPLR